MTILFDGTLATRIAQSTAATPSMMMPSSVGDPVERPKPR
jgi:hypothetical protein